MRLEKGYRSWSSEITPDVPPLEAGLSFAVKFEKGDFLGREALLKQKAAGIKQKLCCLTLADGRVEAIGKEPIRAGDKIIGGGAGGYGYSVGKSTICAYLPIEYPISALEANSLRSVGAGGESRLGSKGIGSRRVHRLGLKHRRVT
jgi:glycine cleavage system aminomethyltransferase T